MRVCNDLAATIIFCPISFSKPFRGNHFPNIYTEIYFDRDRANRFAPSRFFTKKRNEKSIGRSDSRTDSSRCTPKTISASFQSIFSPGQGASELSTRAWWSSVGRRESGKTRRAKEVETGGVRGEETASSSRGFSRPERNSWSYVALPRPTDWATRMSANAYESTPKSRAVRTKQEVLRCALTESYYYYHHHRGHHLGILPYHPSGRVSRRRGGRATERNGRSNIQGEGERVRRDAEKRESTLAFVHAYRRPKFRFGVRATTWHLDLAP